MQTPRGFLIGAGVIAAIAALTSIGHPHIETAVETTAPMVTDAIEDTTATSAGTTDPEVHVLAEHIEAGIDAGAAGAGAAGAATTNELSDGDPTPVVRDATSTPAESRLDSPPPTTFVERGDDRTQPVDPVVDSAPDAMKPDHEAPAEHDCCSGDHDAADDARADDHSSPDDDCSLGDAGHAPEGRRERPCGDLAAGRRVRTGGAHSANPPEVKSTIAYDLPAA